MSSGPTDSPGNASTAEQEAPKASLLARFPFGQAMTARDEALAVHPRQGLARAALYRYAVVITLLIFIVGFSLLLPRTFFTLGNFRTIVSSQAVLMILSLGLTLPLTTGEFDLSIGPMLGCASVLTAFFAGQLHFPLPAVILATVFTGVLAGALNALFVVRIGVNAFIATLGVSTILTGVTLAVSDGQILNTVPQPLVDFAQHQIFGLAVPVYVGFALAIALWQLYEHTPVGRHLFFVGIKFRPQAEIVEALFAHEKTAAVICDDGTLTDAPVGVADLVEIIHFGAVGEHDRAAGLRGSPIRQ